MEELRADPRFQAGDIETEDRLYEETWSRSDYDLIPALQRLQIPTLVIHGDDDLVPLEVVRRIADSIRGARLVVLQDCGHFAFLEQGDQAARPITAFVTSP